MTDKEETDGRAATSPTTTTTTTTKEKPMYDPYDNPPPRPGAERPADGVSPMEPLPQLSTAPPPPQDPPRGSRPWILAGIGLILAGLIGVGSVVLFAGGDDTGTIKPGVAQEDPDDDPGEAPPEEPADRVYSTPQQPCQLIDTARLEAEYGSIVGEPVEAVAEDDTPATGRYELAHCLIVFDKDGKQTRVVVTVNILFEGDEPSPMEAGKTIKESLGPVYDRAFTHGCDDVTNWGGNWQNGVVGNGERCYEADGRTTSNIVLRDGNAFIAVQVTTTDDTRHQEAITQEAKRVAQYAIDQARQQQQPEPASTM